MFCVSSDLNSGKKVRVFHFWGGGVFCVNSDLNSGKKVRAFRWFKFTLKPPYRITHDKLRLAIWDTSFWTFWLKFGHKGP